MASIRSQIIDALIVELKKITVVGPRVFQWMPANPDTTYPFIVVLPQSEDLAEPGGYEPPYGVKALELSLAIYQFFDGEDPARDGWVELDEIFTAVQKAVYADHTFGGLADYADAVSFDMIPPQAQAPNTVACRVPVRIRYKHIYEDPESQ